MIPEELLDIKWKQYKEAKKLNTLVNTRTHISESSWLKTDMLATRFDMSRPEVVDFIFNLLNVEALVKRIRTNNSNIDVLLKFEEVAENLMFEYRHPARQFRFNNEGDLEADTKLVPETKPIFLSDPEPDMKDEIKKILNRKKL